MAETQNDPLLPGYSFNAHLVTGLTPIEAQGYLDFFIDRPLGMKGYILNLTIRGEGVINNHGEQFVCRPGDMLLFQPTLGDWRVHSGTDFACEAGENVSALTDGTVQAVFEDGLYGTCVTLAHAGDLRTTYRGLSEVRVREGQAVSSGEALGVCAAGIPAEEAIGTHVHVEASRGDTVVDVMELLGEEE